MSVFRVVVNVQFLMFKALTADFLRAKTAAIVCSQQHQNPTLYISTHENIDINISIYINIYLSTVLHNRI